jgi:hypothetical protein
LGLPAIAAQIAPHRFRSVAAPIRCVCVNALNHSCHSPRLGHRIAPVSLPQRRMSAYGTQSGHVDALNQCPLSGVKRTLDGVSGMSAYDPKRTFVDGLQFSVTREGEEDWDVRGHTKGAPTITVGAILRNFWATARTGVPAKPQYGGLTAVNVVFVVLIRRPVLFPECFEPLRKLPAGLFHGRNHNDLLCRIRSQ